MANKANIKSIYSLIMALVFVSPQLMMPIHFAFAHHEQHTGANDGKLHIAATEKDCAICDFQFYQFINTFDLYETVHHIKHTFSNISATVTVSIPKKIGLQHAGRAPPTPFNLCP